MDHCWPESETRIDLEVVAQLIARQAPAYDGMRLRLAGIGWDNVTVRVGERTAVRLPRRQAAVALLENELRWLPEIGDGLGVAVPRVRLQGKPQEDYPWPWAIVDWIPGDIAGSGGLPVSEAPWLAGTLRRLHREAPIDAPRSEVRGVPLEVRAEAFAQRYDRLMPELSETAAEGLRKAWSQGEAAPPATVRTWVHGDLHPKNVVLDSSGRLAGLLDWGDCNGGDCASDLAGVWMLFPDASARAAFWAHYQPDPGLVERSRAWAAFYAVSLVGSGEAEHADLGRVLIRTLELGDDG